MNINFLSRVILLLTFTSTTYAQSISKLNYLNAATLPFGYKIDDSTLGGLSGIAYNQHDSLFYMVADKHPARIFKANIGIADSHKIEVNFKDVLYISPELISRSELEGIAINKSTGSYYVSDEQDAGTRIMKINRYGEFLRIVQPVNQGFLPLSAHNAGIEGLTISDDYKHLYYAFERPTSDCSEQNMVTITQHNLLSGNNSTFYYSLHYVEGDKLNTNGVSEILYENDSTLLVLERAFIPGTGNIIRIYQANLDTAPQLNHEDCQVTPVGSKLLFDFSRVKEFAIDNAEGMCFNADKSLLYLVTDNNFSKKQQTQVVALQVVWH